MFKVVDALGIVHDAYGAFVDDNGDIQFILCDYDGRFYKTNHIAGSYQLYEESE